MSLGQRSERVKGYIEISVDMTEISGFALSMIKRKREENAIGQLLKKNPVVGIIGAMIGEKAL